VRRDVDDQRVVVAPVVVGVPDAGRDREQARSLARQLAHLEHSLGRRARPTVEEHDSHRAVRDQIAVGLQLVDPPALDPAGPDRDRVGVDDRLLPERVLEVDDLEE